MMLRARARRQKSPVAPTVNKPKEPKTQISALDTTTLPTNVPHPAAPHTPTEPSTNSDSESRTDLYYRAQANHHPEMGESNAESVLREEQIEQDVRQMKRTRRTQGKKIRHKISIRNNVTEVNLQ
jgi:hypothetical protein